MRKEWCDALILPWHELDTKCIDKRIARLNQLTDEAEHERWQIVDGDVAMDRGIVPQVPLIPPLKLRKKVLEALIKLNNSEVKILKELLVNA